MNIEKVPSLLPGFPSGNSLARFISLLKAWLPYDRPDHLNRLSRLKMFRRSKRPQGNASETTLTIPRIGAIAVSTVVSIEDAYPDNRP